MKSKINHTKFSTDKHKKPSYIVHRASYIVSFFLLCLFTPLSIYTFAQCPAWTAKADFGGAARYGTVGFSIGNQGYVGTGYQTNSPYYSKDFWKYDPSSNVWTQKADFGGTARTYAVGFSIPSIGKGYIGTGEDANGYTKDFWEYDTTANKWTQKANFGGTSRTQAIGFSISSNGYIGTGYDSTDYTKDFWEYNSTNNSWTKKTDFGGTARGAAVGFSITNSGKGYVGTGYDINATHTKDFWEYNPTNNTWAKKADFGGTARYFAVGFSIPSIGKGYIGTGYDVNSSYTKDIWEYNSSTNSWAQKTDFSGTGRYDAVGFSIGTKGYIGAGYDINSTYTKDFREYDPALDLPPTVTVSATLTTCTANNGTATASATGGTPPYSYEWNTAPSQYTAGIKDLAKGDYTITVTDSLGCIVIDTVQIANTDAWQAKVDFGGTERYGAVGFSIGSKGYIGTGYDASGTYTKDFWEYNPTNNTWTQKANFAGSPRKYAVGFSIGSKGYIGTGYDSAGTYTKDFWEYNPAANSWTQKANFGGTAREYAVGFSIGTKGYVGTGYDSAGTYTKDFWEYNSANNTWAQKTNFPGTARYSAVGFSISSIGKGYVGTGWDVNAVETKDFWEYDTTANKWTQKANFAGTGRDGAVAFSLGSKGYIGTGWDVNAASTKDFWEYNPATNTWTQSSDFLGTARYLAVGFSIGTKGYIGTGWDVNSTSTKDFWEYNPTFFPSVSVAITPLSCSTNDDGTATAITVGGTPSYSYEWNTSPAQYTATIKGLSQGSYSVTVTDSFGCTATSAASQVLAKAGAWRLKTDFGGAARYQAVGFFIGTKGYIGTGEDVNYNYTKDFWEYDPTNNSWTQKADFGGTGRYGAVGFSIGTKGYIGTGYDANYAPTKDFWEYDPAGNTWTQKTNFKGSARYNAIGFSVGTKGYIGTGQDVSGYTKDFWEFDPTNNSWTQKANFGGSARKYAVGFSIGSKGYIGTGYDSSYYYAKDFWEFNPSNNSWKQKTDFGGVGRYSAVAFSIGSKGYIGTGYDDNWNYAKDFWEYDTLTNSWTIRGNFSGVVRYQAVGFSIGSKGYIGTGEDNKYKELNDFWEYNPAQEMVLSTTSKNVKCNNGSDGSATVVLKGGIAPFTYKWNTSPSKTTATASNLIAGTYIATVTDSATCHDTISVFIDEPSPLVFDTVQATDVICYGGNGTIKLAASGGTGSLVYSKDSGITYQSSGSFNNVKAGTYKVVAKDSNSCKITDSVAVAQPAKLIVNAGRDTSICLGASTTIGGSPTASGGTSTYTYSWIPATELDSDILENPTATSTTTTKYVLKVTDGNNCTASDSMTVKVNPLPVVSFSGLLTKYCNNAATVTLAGKPTGGYFTGKGISGNLFNANTAGIGEDTIVYSYTDSNSCNNTTTQISTILPLPTAPSICLVTVDTSSTYNQIIWTKPTPQGAIFNFKIYREQSANIDTLLGTVAYKAVNIFNDYSANPNEASYIYKISTVDTCGNESAKSAPHETIHMYTTLGYNSSTVTIVWNKYLGQTVDYYRCWVDALGNNDWTLLTGSISGNISNPSWTDSKPPQNSKARYKMDVVWTNSCDTFAMKTYSSVNTSRSNIKSIAVSSGDGITENELAKQINIYPNPTEDIIHVEYPSAHSNFVVGMYNVYGQKVYEKTVVAGSKNNNAEQINVSSFAKGFYILQIETEKGKIFKKVAIE